MDKIIALTAAQRAEVFQAAAQESGMSAVILEKDFWVCWTLRRLFALPDVGDHLIFKGGTSLSKVWKAISRFSEDIDVSLSREWLGFTGEHDPENVGSRKQQRKRLDDLSAACAEKIRAVLLPALRQDVRAHLGGEIVKASYVATYPFCGQKITAHDVPDATIARGNPVLNLP